MAAKRAPAGGHEGVEFRADAPERTHLRVRCLLADVETLALQPGCADVVSSMVLHYIAHYPGWCAGSPAGSAPADGWCSPWSTRSARPAGR
jgi:hypothetical protein